MLADAFSCRRLEVGSDAISDAGLNHLGRIHRLESLVVTSPRITGAGLGPITELPSLRDLSLITPGLTDVAFDYLSRARSLQKLRLAHRAVLLDGHLHQHCSAVAGVERGRGIDRLLLRAQDDLREVVRDVRVVGAGVRWHFLLVGD